jgi:hypothetical protein
MLTEYRACRLAAIHLQVLAFPDTFPNQGGLPMEVDEAIGRVALESPR